MPVIYKDHKRVGGGKPGKTAYQSAYDAGYSGTVSEFIDTLDTTETNFDVTLSPVWVGSSPPYTQQVMIPANPITGVQINSDDNPTVSIDTTGYSVVPNALKAASSMLTRIITIDGGIIAECHKVKPTVSIPIRIKVVR